MAGGESIYYAFICFSNVVGAVLFISALASPDWYEMHSDTTHFRLGLFQQCSTSGGPVASTRCGTIPEPPCGISSADFRARQSASAACGILGSILCFVVIALSAFTWLKRKLLPQLYVIAGLDGVAILLFLVSIVIFAVTMEDWFYCGVSYCEYIALYTTAQTCAHTHSFCFVYACLAISAVLIGILCVVGLIWFARHEGPSVQTRFSPSRSLHDLVSMSRHSPAGASTRLWASTRGRSHAAPTEFDGFDQDGSPQRDASRARDGKMWAGVGESDEQGGLAGIPRRGTATGGQDGGTQFDGQGPDGALRGTNTSPMRSRRMSDDRRSFGGDNSWPSDWVFHPESKLYWSESHQLYLDPESEQYYDPHSKKWYDPKRDVWLSGDEAESSNGDEDAAAKPVKKV